MISYSSIIDLFADYLSRCGEFDATRTIDEVHMLWHQFGLEWGTFYEDSDLDSFWNEVFSDWN